MSMFVFFCYFIINDVNYVAGFIIEAEHRIFTNQQFIKRKYANPDLIVLSLFPAYLFLHI
ncbi:hypothetical protein AYY16_19200 [Morganella psychrotolerans]|nr:hypothetical protein AYY16_19200 [Morganella psychrotolerans]